MAEKRKLLAEIEKCYKKIDEGVELFEEIMEKMQEANSDNQRDKYQDDLKKEIKKLQRLRDQVKNWQNSSDIKDKEKLIQYRRLIEQRMEQFKDVERENKTKPHSKLGLSAEEKLDPHEKEKAEVTEWIQSQIRSLNDEADRSEMQLESLSNTDTGKKRGKKEDAKTKNEKERRSEELRRHLERLKFHVEKLEVCQRMISNESLNPKQVMDALKEPIEAYVELMDNQDDAKNCYDPDDAYDELNLEKLCAQIGGVNLLSVDDEHGHELEIDTGAVTTSSRHGSGENGQPASPAGRRFASLPLSPHVSASGEPQKLVTKDSSLDRPKSPSMTETSTVPLASTTATPATSTPPAMATTAAAAAGAGASSTPQGGVYGMSYNSVAAGRGTTTPIPSTPVSSTVFTMSSGASTPSSKVATVTTKTTIGTTAAAAAAASAATTPASSVVNMSIGGANSTTTHESSSQNEGLTTSKKDSVASRGSLENSEVSENNTNGEVSKTSTPSSTATSQMTDDSTLRALRLSNQNKENEGSKEPKRAHIPAWLGASPLGRAPNTQEYDIQLAALELAVTRTQLPLDSERPRNYLPKMIVPVPAYYAQTAPANADSLEYYLRLSPDTLFFIFYYMEGTRAQLLAAKALKRLSWRFHTKYLTWFQRHEEPKQITDDYEQGTYVYFDFEKWSQRKKESFTFEYKFLEDKEFD